MLKPPNSSGPVVHSDASGIYFKDFNKKGIWHELLPISLKRKAQGIFHRKQHEVQLLKNATFPLIWEKSIAEEASGATEARELLNK